MSTAIDYVGRTADVACLDWNVSGPTTPLPMTFATGNGGGTVITGVEKVGQRFLMLLFKIMGSDPFRPLEGCRFWADAQRGLWRTTADLSQSFASGVLDIKRQMNAIVLPTDPPDEVLVDATLLAADLSDQIASLRVQITTLAGTTRTIIAPLPASVH